MIINRHNYEEFFLLYVDNELKAEERAEVQKFVEQHPDLKEELDMLQQATLSNDENFCFETKELLYKNETGISLKNYEEYFLLSVDNELSNQQEEEVEKFVLQHPQLQPEYTLLQKTKLQPEQIVFANKDKLFRKERRVIPVAWMRISIAAAVITIIALVSLLNEDKGIVTERNNAALSQNIREKESEKNNQALIKKGVTEQQVAALQQKVINKKDAPAVVAPLVTKVKTPVAFKPKAILQPQLVAVTEVKNKKTNSLPVINKDVAVVEPHHVEADAIETAAQKADADNTGSDGIEANTFKTSLANVHHADVEPVVSNAVYREVESDEEEKSLYIGSVQINKNKLKGLFKKASAFFDKKANRNDDERTLRIAGFAIKTK